MTNMMQEYDQPRIATIGEIAALHPVNGGTVLAMFLTTEHKPIFVRVHEIDLAQEGIDIKVGVQFGAEVNPHAASGDELCPQAFSAIEQLNQYVVQAYIAAK